MPPDEALHPCRYGGEGFVTLKLLQELVPLFTLLWGLCALECGDLASCLAGLRRGQSPDEWEELHQVRLELEHCTSCVRKLPPLEALAWVELKRDAVYCRTAALLRLSRAGLVRPRGVMDLEGRADTAAKAEVLRWARYVDGDVPPLELGLGEQEQLLTQYAGGRKRRRRSFHGR